MSAQQNDQKLTPINPRRRVVAPSPPQPFEVAEVDEDEDTPGALHPITSYSNPDRVRWVPALCLLDELAPKKVREWDAIEDKLTIRSWRMVVQKHGDQQWQTVIDRECGPDENFADITREFLRNSYGPGRYRGVCYALVEDERTGVIGHKHRRDFPFALAAPLQVQAPIAQAPIMPPRAASSGFAPPQPSSFLEYVQFQEMQARIAREALDAAERAEERRLARERSEEERREREEERRERRTRDEQERREREEERRIARERAEEERREREDDRRERRAKDLEMRLIEFKAKQIENVDPLVQLKSMREMMIEANKVFGTGSDSADGSSGGTAERLVGTFTTALEPHVPDILKTVQQFLTDRQRMAHALEVTNAEIARLNAERALRAQNVPAVAVRPIAVPVPRAAAPSQPKPQPAVPTVTQPETPSAKQSIKVPAPFTSEGPEELPEGAPCPACGSLEGCEHFPATVIEESTAAEDDDDDYCEACGEACKHDEATFVDGECQECPPCPHGDEPQAVAIGSIAENPTKIALPSIGAGFVGVR